MLRIIGGSPVQINDLYSGQIGIKKLFIKNTGNAVLEIKSVEPSCACIIPSIQSNRILPNDSTILTIKFDSQFYEGLVKKEVTIASNSPTNPTVVVRILSNVQNLIEVSSRLVKFKKKKVGITVAETLFVSNLADDTVRFVPVKSPHPQLSVKLMKPVLPPHERTKMILKFRPKRPEYRSVVVELKTDKKWNASYKLSCLIHAVQ